MAPRYLATLYDNPRSESTGLVSNARPVWGSKEKREWNGVPTRNAFCQHPEKIMTKTKILTTNAEAPRSQRQSDSTANTQPTKTITTVANDKASEREIFSANPNSELLDHAWAAISALEKERNLDQALRILRRMEESLTLNLTGGSSDA